MKRIIVLVSLFTLLTFLHVAAQVKIGDNPTIINANSLFELESDSKGLLIPRLTTAQINGMATVPDGMMVYNKTAGTLQVRASGSWKSVSTSSAGWGLAGNTGITPNNFIGTINNAGFRVRTNNLQRMVVDSTGKIVMGTYQPSPDGLVNVYNRDEISSLYITNTSTNSNQYGIRSLVEGIAAGSSRTAGEFAAIGEGTNNTAIKSIANEATTNTGGNFTVSGGTTSNTAVRAEATGPNGSTTYGVYASSNHWAGYFLGNSYFSNRVVLGLNPNAENAQLTVRTPDTSYNAIFASTANTGGNGILSTYVGSPNIYYAFWGIAPTTGQNAAGYFSGNVTISGTLSNPSDERLKQNVEPITGMLDKVMKLSTHTYSFKPEYKYMNLPQEQQFGYIAQDLERVFPNLVKNTADKSKGEKNIFYYKSVNYIGMIPVLTKALQEEHEQLLKTQDQLTTLQADNDNLKRRLEKIEAALLKQ